MSKNKPCTKKVTFFKSAPKDSKPKGTEWTILLDKKIIIPLEARLIMGKAINALQKYGTNLKAISELEELSFRPDTRHPNRFHLHIGHRPVYIANWQFDEDRHHIYLIALASHENFNFKKKFSPPDLENTKNPAVNYNL